VPKNVTVHLVGEFWGSCIGVHQDSGLGMHGYWRQRHHVMSKHRESLTWRHSFTPKKTWIFKCTRFTVFVVS